MEKTPFGAKLLLNRAQKRDDIVMAFAFDGLHTINVVTCLAQLVQVLSGDDAFARPSFADEKFNSEPDVQFMLFRPDTAHFRRAIAFYHGDSPSLRLFFNPLVWQILPHYASSFLCHTMLPVFHSVFSKSRIFLG